MHTASDFDTGLINAVLSEKDIAVLFDDHLNYVAVNETICRHLNMKRDELVGRCVLDLFPDIIASTNHRNMLRALDGEAILNYKLIGRNGVPFTITYIPVHPDGYVKGIVLFARTTAESEV